jgi:hypothetical protein
MSMRPVSSVHARAKSCAAILWLCADLLVGCRADPAEPPPPPPLPTRPTLPTPTPEPTDQAAPASPAAAAPTTQGGESPHPQHAQAAAAKESHAHAEKGGDSLYDLAKRGEATLPAPPKAAEPAPPPPHEAPPAHASAPPAPAAPAATKPASKTVVPHTDHLRFEIPAGLQAALDADPRMQPWANQAVKVIDDCYSAERKKNPAAAGVISVRLTMHDEARPDADIKSLPPALSGVVACATGSLMRIKMPLFTSHEGDHYNVNIDFTK